MAHPLQIIKKRSIFILVRNKGIVLKCNFLNIQLLEKQKLENSIQVGFIASKKLGNAIKRNKAKRTMRELARKVITKYGKINSYYVLIAKTQIFEIAFNTQEIELKKLIS